MSTPKQHTIKWVYIITYVISIIAISVLMGYLIAICPCNLNMGTGMLFAFFCYGFMLISIVFHYHKLTGFHLGYSVLSTFLVSIVAIILIVWIEEGIDYSDSFFKNYFLQWVAAGSGFGAVHGIAMFIIIMFKESKKVPQ